MSLIYIRGNGGTGISSMLFYDHTVSRDVHTKMIKIVKRTESEYVMAASIS